jgi:hypothetical protein
VPEQQLSVPIDAVAETLARQRNEAMDKAAQWEALAHLAIAERDQLADELEKLRADSRQADHL